MSAVLRARDVGVTISGTEIISGCELAVDEGELVEAGADEEPVAEIEVPGGVVQVLPSEGLDAEEEGRRRGAERGRLDGEIERLERKLANESFVSKAPADVVEGERRKLEDYREALRRLDEG